MYSKMNIALKLVWSNQRCLEIAVDLLKLVLVNLRNVFIYLASKLHVKGAGLCPSVVSFSARVVLLYVNISSFIDVIK